MECICCLMGCMCLCVLWQVRVENHFKEKLNNLFCHILDPSQLVVDDDIRCLVFGDYMKKGEDKLYDEIQDLDELREVSLS